MAAVANSKFAYLLFMHFFEGKIQRLLALHTGSMIQPHVVLLSFMTSHMAFYYDDYGDSTT